MARRNETPGSPRVPSQQTESSELIVTPSKSASTPADTSLKISIEATKQLIATKSNRYFVPQSVLGALPFPTDQLLVQVLNTSGKSVIEEMCGKVRDICMVILWKVEDTVVIRRCLGVITEVKF